MAPQVRPVAVLIGLMGSGKSTVGAALARRLGVDVIDTDAEVVKRERRSIAAIFADKGEQEFRRIEADVVADVLTTSVGVVSLGGGAVTSPAVQALLAAQEVIYLDVSVADGYARVRHSSRPLLTDERYGSDPYTRYAALHAARADVYAAVSTYRIDTTGRGPEVIVDEILAVLNPSSSLAPQRRKGPTND